MHVITLVRVISSRMPRYDVTRMAKTSTSQGSGNDKSTQMSELSSPVYSSK